DAAENVAESLTKGMRVIVQGRLVQRSFETREGERRTVVELQVDEIGPSMRYATAQVTRASRGGGNFGGGGGNFGGGGGFGGGGDFQSGGGFDRGSSGGGQSSSGSDDPWGSSGSQDFGSNPPF